MHSDRRLLLKSLAAAGLAISGAGWTQLATAANAPAAAAAAGDVLALTSSLSATAKDAALNEAFLSGVRTGARTVSHTAVQGFDSAPFQQLGQMLADGQSTVLVGLLDDASATLVLDMVRSAGGRVLSEQVHYVDNRAGTWAQTLGQKLALGQATPDATSAAGASTRVSFRCLI